MNSIINRSILTQVVETPLLHPERFVNLGIEPPKGVLLYGPPGTGKTLCARAVANRTDACFIRVIGSELVRRYLRTDISYFSHGALYYWELVNTMNCFVL